MRPRYVRQPLWIQNLTPPPNISRCTSTSTNLACQLADRCGGRQLYAKREASVFSTKRTLCRLLDVRGQQQTRGGIILRRHICSDQMFATG